MAMEIRRFNKTLAVDRRPSALSKQTDAFTGDDFIWVPSCVHVG